MLTHLPIIHRATFSLEIDILETYVFPRLVTPSSGHPENYCYRLPTPLYDMPGATRAWFQTIIKFPQEEGYGKVGYSGDMWKACVRLVSIGE